MKGKIAIIADEFALDTPTQHLLDRFLIGFQSDGVFHDAPRGRVSAYVTNPESPLIKKRREDYGLKIAPTPSAAVQDADGVLLCLGKAGVAGEALEATSPRTPVFFYGSPSSTDAGVTAERGLPFEFGTEASSALHLPPMQIPPNARISDGLIISSSQTFAFDLTLSAFNLRPQFMRYIHGQDFWEAGERGEWSWRLLQAALSRTDKAQGNTLLDGRTEDIVGMGLTQSMAQNPRGWLMRCLNNQRIALLDLKGIVGDTLVSVEAGTWRKRTYSTQIFLSPAPQQEEFSRLAMRILDFFNTRRSNRSRSQRLWLQFNFDHSSRLESMQTGRWHPLSCPGY